MIGPVELPTHLNVKERIALGLTVRQLLLLVAGGGLVLMAPVRLPLAAGLSVSVLVAAGTALLVWWQPHQRPLEEWAAALVARWLRPQHSVWRPGPRGGEESHELVLGGAAASAARAPRAWPRLRPARARLTSAQERLPLAAVEGNQVVLRDGSRCAVLETLAVQFELATEEQQEQIYLGFRALLNSVNFPFQVLIRVVPSDVERYLEGLRGRDLTELPPEMREAVAALRRDHARHVRTLAREQRPVERRDHVVIRSQPSALSAQPGWGAIAKALVRPQQWAAGEREGTEGRTLERSVELMGERLASFGVRSRRLSGIELATLWRDVLAGPLTAGRRRAIDPRDGSPVLSGAEAEERGGRAQARERTDG